ncbi:hypothetical protein BJ508DRAFT_336660 [Ascobolus immersus RN42]|uniref:Uncharacterized protein n=1 Tax=Ascobolus immersus RN42 TaxID=1160509 RepID=A0A3N4HEP2_ASCIM|nr:hypothetical protein BJ508DRAFT_336660 [Ascobolus immersus RN42]
MSTSSSNISSPSSVSCFDLSPSFVTNYLDRLPVELKLEIGDQLQSLDDFRAYREAYLTSVGFYHVPGSIRKSFAPIRISISLLNDLIVHYTMNPYLGRLFDLLQVNHPSLDKTDSSHFLSAMAMMDVLEEAAFSFCPEFQHYNCCFNLWNSFTEPAKETGCLLHIYSTCNTEDSTDRSWWMAKALFREVAQPACSTIASKYLLTNFNDSRQDEFETTMTEASSLVKDLAVGLADVAGMDEEGYSYSYRITPIVDVVVSSLAYELISEVFEVVDYETLLMFVEPEAFGKWKKSMVSFVEFLGFLKRISNEFLNWPTLQCHWCCREEEDQWMAYPPSPLEFDGSTMEWEGSLYGNNTVEEGENADKSGWDDDVVIASNATEFVAGNVAEWDEL